MAGVAAGAEPVSRLDAAKEVVSQFVQARPNDRIGLVAFAGEPYLASPLTLDHDWVLQNLARLDSDQLGDGTAIGSAIAAGVRRLDAQGAKSKILIVLTDGQNNAGKIQPSVAAEAAKALGREGLRHRRRLDGRSARPGHRRPRPPAARRRARRRRRARHEAGRRADGRQVLPRDRHRNPCATSTPTSTGSRRRRAPSRASPSTTSGSPGSRCPASLLVLAELGLSATRFRRVP